MDLFALISGVSFAAVALFIVGLMLRRRGWHRVAAVLWLGAGAGLVGALSVPIRWLSELLSQVAALPWLLGAVALFLFVRLLLDLVPKLGGTATAATATVALLLPVFAGLAGRGWLTKLVAAVSGAVLHGGDAAMTAAF